MKTDIQIVDRGRGPQFSTSRITVQDLVPYLKRNCTCEEIREVMPILSVEEIQAVKKYVQENYQAVMEQDRHIGDRAEARRQPAEREEAERQQRQQRLEAARQMIRQRKQEPNGDRAAR